MTNNAYLLRNSGTETECLFESYTTIPYFWFALINTRVIKKMGEEIIRLFKRSARKILSNSRIAIKLPRDYMLENAERGKVFFKENQPALSNLYNDFVSCLGSLFNQGDTLELNIIEVTDFNTTIRSMNQVKEVVRSIQLREDVNRYFEIYGLDHDPLTLAGDDRSLPERIPQLLRRIHRLLRRGGKGTAAKTGAALIATPATQKLKTPRW